ncbi:MAG: PqqD family protein [Chloroflexota bacterium]
MMVELETIYRKAPDMVSRQVAGEAILVPIRRNVGDLESIYTLNETGARAWALLDGQRSLAHICEQIILEYEVGAEQAQQDLLELVSQLEAIQAIHKV